MLLAPADRNSDSQIASRAAFLAGWLGPQIAALAISAFRVPLWARFPVPGEMVAAPLMLAVQIGSASLMLPTFQDRTKSAMALLSAWPMALIAGTLGAARLGAAICGEIEVTLWIVAIAGAAIACRSARARAVVWAVAILWSSGGGLLVYLRLEFLTADPLPVVLAGPLVGAVRTASADSIGISWLPFVPTTISLLFLTVSRTLRVRAAQT